LELSQNVFDQLRTWIHEACGIYLHTGKEYLIQQRLGAMAAAEGCQDFSAFFHKLRNTLDPEFKKRVIAAITTNETYFFRDQHPFDTFTQTLLPRFSLKIREKKQNGQRPVIRIWSAGASTGQEAYSIAMLIHEYCEKPTSGGLRIQDFEIIGTDISTPALVRARTGEYSDLEISRGLSPARRDRFFTRIMENRWQLSQGIRKMVTFHPMNFMENFLSLGCFDMILCRNVLIYFDEATKRRIFDCFATMLEPDGCLILGGSENIYGISTAFRSKREGMTLLYEKQPSKGPLQISRVT
jgi:chemotaxis protein methyltransferase CheR